MTDRMAKLDRLLALVHALAESAEGLTLDEMAARLGVDRRTAERMRDVIARHFDLDERRDDRRKRFFIRDSLRRVYTRPTAAEVAALQAEVDGRAGAGPQGVQLASLLGKIRSALDDRDDPAALRRWLAVEAARGGRRGDVGFHAVSVIPGISG